MSHFSPFIIDAGAVITKLVVLDSLLATETDSDRRPGNMENDPKFASDVENSPFEDRLDERVPLVHPSAHPEQPHACGRYGNDDVGNGGVVLGEGAGGPA